MRNKNVKNQSNIVNGIPKFRCMIQNSVICIIYSRYSYIRIICNPYPYPDDYLQTVKVSSSKQISEESTGYASGNDITCMRVPKDIRTRRKGDTYDRNRSLHFSEFGDIVGDNGSSGTLVTWGIRPAKASGNVEVSPKRPTSPSRARSSTVDEDRPNRPCAVRQVN